MDPATLEALNRASSLELFHLSTVIELPPGSRAAAQAPAPRDAPRPTRADFRVGDRVSFEDRHLQTRIGTIVRINQKTASIDCEGEAGWRVSFALLRHVVDL